MVEREKSPEQPGHSGEPKDRRKGDNDNHEVDSPQERVDDEVGSDEQKRTKRQE